MPKTLKLELTQLELNALRIIIIDRATTSDLDSEQWEDVTTGEVVTLEDLLTLVSQ